MTFPRGKRERLEGGFGKKKKKHESMDKNCKFSPEICHFDLHGWDSLSTCYDRGKLWCCVGGRLKHKFISSNELIKVEWPP